MDEVWGHVQHVLDDKVFIVDVTATAADGAYEDSVMVEAVADVHVGDFVHLFVIRRDAEGKLFADVVVEAELDPDEVTNDDAGWELVVGQVAPAGPARVVADEPTQWPESDEEPSRPIVVADPSVRGPDDPAPVGDPGRGRGRRTFLRARGH